MRTSSSLLIAILLAACGGSVPAPPASHPEAPRPPPGKKVEAPDASRNVVRDRRSEPGVRAAPKPLVVGGASSVQCGKLKKAPPDAPTSELLGGRVVIRAPEGAKVPPPLPEGPSPEEESRVVVTGTKLALAIVARETFQLDPDLYEADPEAKLGSLDVEAPKFLKATFPMESPVSYHPVAIGASNLRAYVARPERPNAPPGKDTALVLALLVAQDDGTLESLSFYVRGEAVRTATGDELVGCTRLAERIASTALPGPRKLERSAGRRHVADLSNGAELAIHVPDDYVSVNAKAGARLLKLRPLSLFAGSINVVVTSEPPKAPDAADAKVDGTLLGRPVEWRGKLVPKGAFLFAGVPLDSGQNAEVLLKATRDSKALDEMRAIAETLEAVKR